MNVSPPDTALPAHSNVIVFPPVIPVSGFVLGLLMEAVWPLAPLVPAVWRSGAREVGAVLLLVGTAGFAWMVATMKRAGTPIHNARTPTALVESGPFRFTRNPMYLFGSIAYAGLALVLLQPWCLLLLSAVVALIHYGVVLREEAFLERRFGAPYKAYQSRVRRWM